jgi:hypothetical protein
VLDPAPLLQGPGETRPIITGLWFWALGVRASERKQCLGGSACGVEPVTLAPHACFMLRVMMRCSFTCSVRGFDTRHSLTCSVRGCEVSRSRSRELHALRRQRAMCVGVLRVDGTWHADGARVGDAQQTRRGHAQSSTHSTNQASGPTAVSTHRPRPAQAAARSRSAQQAARAHAQPPAMPRARRTRMPWRSSKASPLASAHEMRGC